MCTSKSDSHPLSSWWADGKNLELRELFSLVCSEMCFLRVFSSFLSICATPRFSLLSCLLWILSCHLVLYCMLFHHYIFRWVIKILLTVNLDIRVNVVLGHSNHQEQYLTQSKRFNLHMLQSDTIFWPVIWDILGLHKPTVVDSYLQRWLLFCCFQAFYEYGMRQFFRNSLRKETT